MQAMILAAGFGTRLQPFTNIRPKPLFPLLNTPLLLLTIQHLKDAGCDHIVVNGHHLKEQIGNLIVEIPGVYFQEEEVIMGTGGGLRLALDLFRNEPLLITNGDIYHNVDYRQLYDNHIDSGAGVTLAVHDYPRFNGLSVQSSRLLSFEWSGVGDMVAFTGLHMLDPKLLNPLSSKKESSIIEWYKTLLDNGQRINIFRVDDCFWTDMGTFEDYLQLHDDLLNNRIPCWSQLEDKTGSAVFIDKGVQVGKKFQVKDWACIGKAHIGDNVTVSRSVIWDNAIVPDNSDVTDSLIA